MLLSGCAVYQTDSLIKIALLTSFEGRYREIGYNALYAVQLALKDSGVKNIHLISVDDGGTIASATIRARALQRDPALKMVLLVGIYATHNTVQQALGDTPVLIVGHWNAAPVGENAFMLTSAELDSLVTLPDDFEITDAPELTLPIVGSDILALAQLPLLNQSPDNITVVSSGTLPDENFRQRYLSMDLFAPEPGLLATLAYDAAGLAIKAIKTGTSLSDITYSGMNGTIQFENKYWQNAPIHRYRYSDTRLVPVN
jgi:hypothetical protein